MNGLMTTAVVLSFFIIPASVFSPTLGTALMGTSIAAALWSGVGGKK